MSIKFRLSPPRPRHLVPQHSPRGSTEVLKNCRTRILHLTLFGHVTRGTCLALGVGGGLALVRRGNGVQVLHHALQVPHLVVQLLRAVAAVASLKYFSSFTNIFT